MDAGACKLIRKCWCVLYAWTDKGMLGTCFSINGMGTYTAHSAGIWPPCQQANWSDAPIFKLNSKQRLIRFRSFKAMAGYKMLQGSSRKLGLPVLTHLPCNSLRHTGGTQRTAQVFNVLILCTAHAQLGSSCATHPLKAATPLDVLMQPDVCWQALNCAQRWPHMDQFSMTLCWPWGRLCIEHIISVKLICASFVPTCDSSNTEKIPRS